MILSQEFDDTMSLDEYLIENREATFLLKVKGDSMVEAGILSGDTIIVERGKTPRVGDIVVVEEDGEYKMKYLPKKGKEMLVVAVVKALIRKYE